jgi:hypothetical protein
MLGTQIMFYWINFIYKFSSYNNSINIILFNNPTKELKEQK